MLLLGAEIVRVSVGESGDSPRNRSAFFTALLIVRFVNWPVLGVPEPFMAVRYNGARYPGAASGADADLSAGANCQLFAYALLRHFGLEVPPLRSSELWADTSHTEHVRDLGPLDLLFWNRTPDLWGAHIGVCLGDKRAVHLTRSVGVPVIWPLSEFGRHPKYRVFLGAKRVLKAA